MASDYSPLKIELIKTGEQVATWGQTTNTNLGTAIEQAIGGKQKIVGYFEDLEFAELVAIEARNKFHGSFARS